MAGAILASMETNAALIARFLEAQRLGDAAVLNDSLADDVVWHVPGRNLLSRDYRGKAEVMGFWAHVRELSGGSVRTEVIGVLGGDPITVALVRVFAEREGKSLDGSFQAWAYRVEEEHIAEIWFLVEDRYAVDAFWS
jgi:ketosteroid isomerase-like protein